MSVADKTPGRALLTFAAVAAIVSGLAMPAIARAEVAPADPIDTAMRACLARADRSSPQGQAECMDAAGSSWQSAIDAAYRSIVATAPDKARRGWQESQRRWLAWRELETPLVRAVFATTQGSSYIISEANVLLQPVRDRALQLRRAAAQFQAQTSGASASDPAPAKPATRVRPCTADAACEHAQFDLNRYARKLRAKLPVQSRPVLARAQRAWRSYLEATAELGTEADRVDLIGGRVATFKRLSDTVGND
jgi:uncharacterized protein YecT (DUF1311 family)